MHHVRDLRFRALAVGAVLDHRQQVLDFALFVADRHPRRGDDAGSGARRRGRMLVVELRLPGAHQLAVVLGDQLGGLRRENLLGRLADHALALGAEVGLAGAVDQEVAQRLGFLHDDGRRHVLDHRGGEQMAAVALLLGAAVLGDVLVRHHPAVAVRRRLADHRDDPLVGQFHLRVSGLAFLHRTHQFGDVSLRIDRKERALGHARTDQVLHGGARLHVVRRQAVDLHVALVADHQAARRVEHVEALRHVVEGRVELDFLLVELLLGAPLLGDVLERRDPAAGRHRLHHDAMDAAAANLGDLGGRLPLAHRCEHRCGEWLRIAGEIALRLAALQQLGEREAVQGFAG